MHVATLSDFFTEDELRCRETVRASLGHDWIASSDAWERVVARIVDGTVTSWKHPWDVTVDIWGRECRIEVKFSRAYAGAFSQVRGNECSRNVFKWAGLRREQVDAIVLIGLDVDDTLITLVLSPASLQGASTSLTMTAPSSSKAPQKLSWASVPATELLPAVAQICHNTYDSAHRAANRARGRG